MSGGLTAECIHACYGTVDMDIHRKKLELEATEKIRPMIVPRSDFHTLFEDKDTVMDVKLASYLTQRV